MAICALDNSSGHVLCVIHLEALTMLWMAILIILVAGCNQVNSPKQSESNSLANENRKTFPITKPTLPLTSDYEPIPLDRLVGISELVVLGKVRKLTARTFTLQIDLTLVGELSHSEIEVLQFTPSRFEGTPRPAPYKTGQTFLLFLRQDGTQEIEKQWGVLGMGGEGEMPVQDGFVYFAGRNVEGIPFGSHRVHEAERTIQRFEAPVFFDAIKRYRNCFAWQSGKGGQPEPAKICDEAAMDQYSRTSVIHTYLAQATAKRIRNK